MSILLFFCLKIYLIYVIYVIATGLCFTLKDIYTREVIAAVLQQLVDQTQLPTLLMRTVLQSISLYKDLHGFVNSILIRLIHKKIWTLPKLWEGFIRCCTMTFPTSLPVLYALPKPQAQEMILKSPKLKESLRILIEALPPHQRQRREFQSLLPLIESV